VSILWEVPRTFSSGQYLESVHLDGNCPLFWTVFIDKNCKNSPPAALLVKIHSFNFGREVSRNRKFGKNKWTVLRSVRTLPPRVTLLRRSRNLQQRNPAKRTARKQSRLRHQRPEAKPSRRRKPVRKLRSIGEGKQEEVSQQEEVGGQEVGQEERQEIIGQEVRKEKGKEREEDQGSERTQTA